MLGVGRGQAEDTEESASHWGQIQAIPLLTASPSSVLCLDGAEAQPAGGVSFL